MVHALEISLLSETSGIRYGRPRVSASQNRFHRIPQFRQYAYIVLIADKYLICAKRLCMTRSCLSWTFLIACKQGHLTWKVPTLVTTMRHRIHDIKTSTYFCVAYDCTAALSFSVSPLVEGCSRGFHDDLHQNANLA